jgi:hypothetical protein
LIKDTTKGWLVTKPYIYYFGDDINENIIWLWWCYWCVRYDFGDKYWWCVCVCDYDDDIGENINYGDVICE